VSRERSLPEWAETTRLRAQPRARSHRDTPSEKQECTTELLCFYIVLQTEMLLYSRHAFEKMINLLRITGLTLNEFL
jgi:hypothetical protein